MIRDENTSAVGMIESDELSQQGGLAVSGSPHDGEHLAATHLQANSVQHAVAAKRFVQILSPNLDTGRRHSSPISAAALAAK